MFYWTVTMSVTLNGADLGIKEDTRAMQPYNWDENVIMDDMSQ